MLLSQTMNGSRTRNAEISNLKQEYEDKLMQMKKEIEAMKMKESIHAIEMLKEKDKYNALLEFIAKKK